MQKIFIAAMIFLLQFSICAAEEKIIEAEGIYIFENNSVELAKEKAKRRALNLAIDKAGVYVESYSKIENFNLTKDEIKIVSGDILQIKKIRYEITKKECKAVVTVIINTDNISSQLKKDKEKLEILKARTATLRKDYDILKLENSKMRNSQEYKLFSLYQKAVNKEIDFEDREKSVQEILKINSSYRNGIAYALQAEIYNEQFEYQKALEYDLKYLEQNHGKAGAYYFCALDYQNLRDWENAFKYIWLAVDYEPENLVYESAKLYIYFDYKKNNQAV